MFNCPNCGARVSGWKCEYCETVFPERKVKENELDKLITDYSKEIETLSREMAQRELELEALYEDFNKSFDDIDDIENWKNLILIIFWTIVALLTFLP